MFYKLFPKWMDGRAIMTLVKMVVPFKNVFPEITVLWLSDPLGEVGRIRVG